MANLELNRQLRLRYDSSLRRHEKLFEHINVTDPDRIEKAITDSAIFLLDGDYHKYFVEGESAYVYLMFIDVCKFSTRYGHLTGKEISGYFDLYYDIVIPIIYNHGGTIDKIMGDGIVVVFGQPFLNLSNDECFKRVDACARDIISLTSVTGRGAFSSKIAIISGNVNYYKNKTIQYQEHTIVGTPLTHLFRLETVAIEESISFFSESNIADNYADFLKDKISTSYLRDRSSFLDDEKRPWGLKKTTIDPLPGVKGQNAIFSLEFIK